MAIGRDSSANLAKKLEYAVRNPSKLLNLARIRGARTSLDNLKQMIATECEVDAGRLRFREYAVEHHVAHIASAFFPSGWEAAAGLSVDGSGDFVTCMFADCRDDRVEVRRRIYVPHSLGSLYTMICQFLGYGQYGDEGKVMGLAPLGTDRYCADFDEMITLTKDGIELNSKYFVPFGAEQGMRINADHSVDLQRHYSDYMIDRFGPPRQPDQPIEQRDMDLAYGLQHTFERGYMHLLNLLHQMVPNPRVVLSGGCALNSVANGKLFDQTPFRETWIQPAAGDDGLALGAALQVARTEFNEPRWQMTDAYLGPAYSDAEILAALKESDTQHIRLEREELLARTAEFIEHGNVVGWYPGPDGMGPSCAGQSLDTRASWLSRHERHPERPHQAARVVPAVRAGGPGRASGRNLRVRSSLAIHAARLQDQAGMARAAVGSESRRRHRPLADRAQGREPALLRPDQGIRSANRDSRAAEYQLQ